MNVIEIKNLKKNYGKARGIIDVSFEVGEGEIRPRLSCHKDECHIGACVDRQL